MSACREAVGSIWQNDFEPGLLQKLLFHSFIPDMWSHGEVQRVTAVPMASQNIAAVLNLSHCWINLLDVYEKKKNVKCTLLICSFLSQNDGDTAVEQGTMGALWHQPLDSPSCSPKTLNSPTMNCCSGKGGLREFNFQHNWLYSTPLNAKEMVCSVCLCEELCLQPLSSSRKDRGKKDGNGGMAGWRRAGWRDGVGTKIEKKKGKETQWMTRGDREGEKKKYRENENSKECLLWLSFGQPHRNHLKDNAATSRVWRLSPIWVNPAQRKHTYSQVLMMHRTPDNRSPTKKNRLLVTRQRFWHMCLIKSRDYHSNGLICDCMCFYFIIYLTWF